MNATANINMLEATRLTREGRLAEAMAILQGGLASGHPSTTSGEADGSPDQRPAGHAGRIIDMVPPASGGGAWTPPKFTFPNRTPDAFNGSAGG